jgi:hypothetical protein
MPPSLPKYRLIRLEPEYLRAGWGVLTLTLGVRRYRYDWGFSQLFTRIDEELLQFQKQLEVGRNAEMTLLSEPGRTIILAQTDAATGWTKLEAWASWPGEDRRRDLAVFCAPSALHRAVRRAVAQSKP